MNPDVNHLWRAPLWMLALLFAALAMLGPFAIDAYLPAFSGIGLDLAASPLQMQQTLSAYLFAFAAMNLLHGALSDSFGRRPVVLVGVAVFTLASVGCALAEDIGTLVAFRALQGLSSGAGIVVSRAAVRDLFPPAQAQRVMAQITLFFGIAPAIAPLAGGWLFVFVGWRAIFWGLAGFGVLLWMANLRLLPETLPPANRHPFNARHLAAGYLALGRAPRFLLLALASGVPFNAMFLYVLGAPVFLGEVLALPPTRFFGFFCAVIGGIMAGAWVSGRLAGRVAPARQVRLGFSIMLGVAAVNIGLSALLPPHPVWSIPPVAALAFGWSLLTPSVTLLALEVVPHRRGMAASMLAFVGSLANGLVAGVVAPLAMHSALAMALVSGALMLLGLVAWAVLRHRWPDAAVGASAPD
jgi:DHA1 family bicyclomycin/chloramphenicol resistance-like MFS transporter